MSDRLRLILVNILLMPLMPCFMWGPFVHPQIARRAFERAQQEPDSVGKSDVMTAIRKNKATYIYAANAPDAISTNHVLRNVITYDYAHNNIPDEPDGKPVFGYRLLQQARARLKSSLNSSTEQQSRSEREVAFACGWLTHQLADWITHYEEHEGTDGKRFRGYANSHQVIGSCFYDDVLQAKEAAEHGLLETLHDIYAYNTDRSGYLSLGRNAAELPTDKEDNLISAVSATFGHNYCKIPPNHLDGLGRDFNIVIDGMESLFILLSRLQPRLSTVVAAFIDDGRLKHVDRAVDYAFDNLFALSDEELTERAWYRVGEERAVGRLEIVPKKESIVQQWAFKVGQSIKPQDVAALLKEGPLVTLDLKGLLGRCRWVTHLVNKLEVQTDILARLKDFAISRLDQVIDRSEATRGLTRFVRALLIGGDDVFEVAQDAYCSKLRPIAQLDVDGQTLGTMSRDGLLEKMVDEGVIRVRFTPAIRTDKNTTRYKLNEQTVDIRINGYSASDHNAPFTQRRLDSTDGILHYEIRLKDGYSPRVVHLFADIKDCTGDHSQYIDCQYRRHVGD